MKTTIFISSVQRELQPERGAIKAFLQGDPLCRRYFDVFLFEDLPASDRRADEVYLDRVDQAVDFVMARITRSIGIRARGPQAPVDYELPRQAVAEAIVNAVAHRDYASNASVQVMLFADRLEVWNPGELPPSLTPELLRMPHASIPRNPLICEPMFLSRYAEKAGTGILDMIAVCREDGLPEPEFRQSGGQFIQILWQDWLTEALMDQLDLDERQRKALAHLGVKGRITSSDYQSLTGTSRQTTSRDLADLVRKGLIGRRGEGRGTFYVKTPGMPRK